MQQTIDTSSSKQGHYARVNIRETESELKKKNRTKAKNNNEKRNRKKEKPTNKKQLSSIASRQNEGTQKVLFLGNRSPTQRL